ncbi:glycosyltransferase [Pedobacter sp. MC2016-14]|uniref:glycosyltransferase family 2 protein n=1 Tax=Pedobacter sp. MC2016-14 TaxID=2897327 RepID=UPI001E55C210|nr:glycosyltransferase family 2 protein [Pedobacter sp. MC2016-14]MCD0486844.1 glycosyltransferase [Pedobacter sp. MC2016-14]
MSVAQIDVIIAVYNGAQFISEAIHTIQAQTWKDLRIIVADDGSADETVQMVKEMCATDDRIMVLERPHTGVAKTLNAALASSSAPYIAILDADDLWAPEKLEKQLQSLQNTGLSACFCMIREFETFNPAAGTPAHQARPQLFKGYAKTAFLAKREVFDTFGDFDENLPTGDFVEWYSRLLRANEPVVMLDEVLAYRRIHHHNTTSNTNKNDYLQILKAHLDEKRRAR